MTDEEALRLLCRSVDHPWPLTYRTKFTLASLAAFAGPGYGNDRHGFGGEGILLTRDYPLWGMARHFRMPEADLLESLADLHAESLVYHWPGVGILLFPHTRDGRECRAIIEEAGRRLNDKRSLKVRALDAWGCRCAYCGREGDEERDPDGRAWHLDRIHPGLYGGKYIPENVCLSCARCNIRKGAKLAVAMDSLVFVEELQATMRATRPAAL